MDFSEALKAADEGKKITDGNSVLVRRSIRRNDSSDVIHALCEINKDGELSQVMPCGAFFEANWEIIEE